VTATADVDLQVYLRAQRERVEAALARAVNGHSQALPAPLAEAMTHGLLSGGKRLRPILCMAAFQACSDRDPGDALDDLAVSLEIIHAYSLMHDDLPCMDDAALRRGVPTTHRVHGVAPTTLAGAVMIPLAAEQALRGARGLGLPETTARTLARTLMEASGAGGMVGGQALDLLGEGRALSAEELDELHRLKTGALLSAAPRMGGIAAGAPAPVQEALGRYGRRIGLAFQIADDLLDATASVEELGKNPSDTQLGKSTYVALYGLTEARRRGDEQVREALEALDAVALAAPPLRALAGYIMERTH
jgi:geranylgeranyl pyrophosphate synthase